ncbi:MAG TPA: glucose-6-phosphate dehydrogenase assembly protein OpcA [Roseiflexaceae bacterium]|nr:glucose-6-phosphate dehydrogenase assembly protein OpcA [Roseiflexaceae bacterium]
MSAPPPLEATHVDIRAIERELTALWQSAAESAEAGHSAPVTRTCLANLVVVVDNRESALHATRVVQQLTAVYPNRAIVAAALPEAPGAPALDAWVQALCQLPVPGRPQVCGEQITIEARGQAAAHIPGVVLPLLVPDVPVAIWLPRGNPAGHPVARRLADVADRLIVDSETFDGPQNALAALAGLIGGEACVSDLAWARLTRWRELVAQFFDAPAARRQLPEIELLEITVATPPGIQASRSPALLLAGWLATRLGWRVEGRGENARLLRQDGAQVRLEVATVPAGDGQDDRLASLTLICRAAHFSVTRVAAGDVVATRAEIEGRWQIRRSLPLERLDEVALVAGELQLLGRDPTFESALLVAAALAVDERGAM